MNSVDTVFLKKKELLRSTLGFLNALKSEVPFDLAKKISDAAFSNYMISVYEEVLHDTPPGSQGRFDAFRNFYNLYSKNCSYCEVLTSRRNLLIVKYTRCPLIEILKHENLFEFSSSSCRSDDSFTRILLPGVQFSRKNSIQQGQNECIMQWKF